MIERQHGQLSLPAKMDAAVLVLDERPEVHSALDRMAGDSLELFMPEKHPGGFALLESKEVAVLVADIDMEAENYLVFFNLLKNKYPQILVVVLTSASDSETCHSSHQRGADLSLPEQAGELEPDAAALIALRLGRYAEYRVRPGAPRATQSQGIDQSARQLFRSDDSRTAEVVEEQVCDLEAVTRHSSIRDW